jgi:hypothetical protein
MALKRIENKVLNQIRIDLYGKANKEISEDNDLSKTTVTNFLTHGLATDETLEKILEYIKLLKVSK